MADTAASADRPAPPDRDPDRDYAPLGAPGQWAEAHACLALLFQKHGRRLDGVRQWASHVRASVEPLFPVFEGFCREAIRYCPATCCAHAIVDFDFKDLLFWYALNLLPPPRPIRTLQSERCSYLGSTGCRLDRIMRPFICTWYYCPQFMDLFYRLPSREQRRLSGLMSAAQAGRKEMEAEFIRVTAGD